MGRPQWQIDLIAQELKIHPRLTYGLPDRWLDDPTWRCINRHVSKRYLSTSAGDAVCFKCRADVWLTFPEDTDVEDTDLPPGVSR